MHILWNGLPGDREDICISPVVPDSLPKMSKDQKFEPFPGAGRYGSLQMNPANRISGGAALQVRYHPHQYFFAGYENPCSARWGPREDG